jgi:hypothetical protein
MADLNRAAVTELRNEILRLKQEWRGNTQPKLHLGGMYLEMFLELINEFRDALRVPELTQEDLHNATYLGMSIETHSEDVLQVSTQPPRRP